MDDEVVIIGAGICGLATALALHKKGIKSVVMERSESLRNDGVAIGIQPNGWRALDQLGVADILRQRAILVKRERFVSLDGGREKEISLFHWDGELRCLRRKDLIDSLYDALPSSTVKFGYQLESIKSGPRFTKPVLQFVNGISIAPKVVIGCDGSKSIVADFLNLKPTKMFSLSTVRGVTNYPNGHSFDHEFDRFIKDNILVGRVIIDDKSVYWFCSLPYIPKDKKVWGDPDSIRRSTLELVSDYPREIQEMIKSTETKTLSFTNLRYRAPWDLLVGPFCKGTVIVAGDAMHVMGPFVGQGGSTALEDAVVLARSMARLGMNNAKSGSKLSVHGVEEAFKQFGKQRRMRLTRLSLQTYLIAMLTGSSSRLKKFIYVMLLKLLFHNKNSHVDYDCGEL